MWWGPILWDQWTFNTGTLFVDLGFIRICGMRWNKESLFLFQSETNKHMCRVIILSKLIPHGCCEGEVYIKTQDDESNRISHFIMTLPASRSWETLDGTWWMPHASDWFAERSHSSSCKFHFFLIVLIGFWWILDNWSIGIAWTCLHHRKDCLDMSSVFLQVLADFFLIVVEPARMQTTKAGSDSRCSHQPECHR